MYIFKKLFITIVISVGLLAFIQAQTNAQNLYSAVPVSDLETTGNSIKNANTSRCLAVTADGTIYAVYHGSNGIRVAKSTNRGASFSPSVLVKISDFETEIAVSSTGTVYVTWVNNESDAYLSKSTDNGKTFSSPIKVGTAISSVHMAVDGNYVYLIDRPGINFYYSSDSGQTFKKQTFDENYVFSDVHVNRLTGEVIVQKDKPEIVYYVSQDHGQTFGSEKTPSGASVNYSVGSISSGPLGTYLLVGGYSTMGARINLSNATAKTLPLGSSLTPQGRSLSVDGFGNVVTGFISNGNVYYAASKNLGDTFGTTRTVAAANMANAAINTTNGDVMFLYEAGGKIYLSVFGDELTGYSLDVSTTNLNFGNQEVGTSSATKDITVTNKSSKAIAVTKLDITGSDFSVSHNIGSALNPGESYTISVVFTPSKFNTCSGMISIYTDAFKDPRTIQLSGSGVDGTFPSTTVQISGTKGSDGKYTSDVTLKFDASDIAGIAKTEYSLNNGQSWIQASGSAAFSDEGDYNVLYRSVDKAGNVETAKQISFTIKKLPKTVTLTYSGDHGHITGQASQTVNYGGSGTEVTAVPDEGYHFVKWSDGKTDASRTDANITTDISITASFAINTYTLNYSGVHGSISGLASQTVDFGGSGTAVTAVPDEGYHFVSWSDGVTTACRTDANIRNDISITATFAINTYNLKYTSGDHGSITGSAIQAVNHGDSATEVTAVPDEGYHFVSWSDGVTTACRTDANIRNDISITATFAINTYTLNYSGMHGSISGLALQTVDFGGSGTAVTAVPDEGYHFVNWSDGVTTARRTDANIKTDASITAIFDINTYNLKYTSGDHGSITGSAIQAVNHGDSGTEVTAVPDEGYHFVKWSDGKTDASRIDKNITTNASITATFAINTYTLNYSGVHGSISGLASQTVDFGGSGTEVTAVPDEGYHFVSWSDGKTDASRIDGNITTNASITATFAINTYNLKYTSGDHGSITGSAIQAVNHGDSGTEVTAMPDEGYHFVNWSDGKTDARRIDGNITTNASITATFAINTYNLKYTSGDHGSITGSAIQVVNYGDSGTEITAVPDEGYHFVNWSDSKTDASRIDGNITTDASITATFAINTYNLKYTSGGHGSITGSAIQVVNHGESGAEVIAVPDSGYYFVKWSDGVTTAKRTDSKISSDKSVTATFDRYSTGNSGSSGGGGGGGSPAKVTIPKEEIPAATPVDLVVSVSADKRMYAENQEITYIVDYSNKLDSKAGEFEITADIPSSASVTDNGGGKVDDNIIRFKVPSLEGKASGQLTYKLKIGDVSKQEATISSTVTVSGAGIINTGDDKSQVSVMLRSSKYGKLSHKGYIKGYPGNTFNPEHPITRAEVTVIMSRIMNLSVTDNNKSTFKDVDNTHWGYKYIMAVSDAGILKGYEDGTFRPDAPISRAELTTLVSRYMKLENTKPLKNYFNDTSSHWANNYIEEISRCKIIEGYNDGSFKPDEKIKRSEAVTIINKMLCRGPLVTESSDFKDVSKDYWAFGQIEEASADHESIIDENGAESLK